MLWFRYDSMKTLDDADEKEVVAMTEDSTIGMKKPHRTVFIKAWKELQKARMNAASQGVPPQLPPQVYSV
jgi:hypothetical protein